MSAEGETRWIELTGLQATEAQLLAGRLESAGIEARTDPPWIAGWPGYPFGGIAQRLVKVLVPEDRLEEARGIVAAIEHG